MSVKSVPPHAFRVILEAFRQTPNTRLKAGFDQAIAESPARNTFSTWEESARGTQGQPLRPEGPVVSSREEPILAEPVDNEAATLSLAFLMAIESLAGSGSNALAPQEKQSIHQAVTQLLQPLSDSSGETVLKLNDGYALDLLSRLSEKCVAGKFVEGGFHFLSERLTADRQQLEKKLAQAISPQSSAALVESIGNKNSQQPLEELAHLSREYARLTLSAEGKNVVARVHNLLVATLLRSDDLGPTLSRGKFKADASDLKPGDSNVFQLLNGAWKAREMLWEMPLHPALSAHKMMSFVPAAQVDMSESKSKPVSSFEDVVALLYELLPVDKKKSYADVFSEMTEFFPQRGLNEEEGAIHLSRFLNEKTPFTAWLPESPAQYQKALSNGLWAIRNGVLVVGLNEEGKELFINRAGVVDKQALPEETLQRTLSWTVLVDPALNKKEMKSDTFFATHPQAEDSVREMKAQAEKMFDRRQSLLAKALKVFKSTTDNDLKADVLLKAEAFDFWVAPFVAQFLQPTHHGTREMLLEKYAQAAEAFERDLDKTIARMPQSFQFEEDDAEETLE